MNSLCLPFQLSTVNLLCAALPASHGTRITGHGLLLPPRIPLRHQLIAHKRELLPARRPGPSAPSVVDRWWSSRGTPLRTSNSGLHRWSLLPHETTLSSSNPSRVSACSLPLRLAAEQISSCRFLGAVYAIRFRASQLPLSSAVLCRTVSATPHTAVSPHSISIGPASSAATTGGFLLTALSNARRAPCLP